MGLKELVGGILDIEDDDRDAEYQEGDLTLARQEARDNLKLAQLFLKFNPNKGYYFTQKPKSRLYSKEEIAQILIDNGYANSLEQGIERTEELIKKDFIDFYWATKGASGVNIKELKNLQGDTKYRFELDFCDDGL